MRALVGLLAAAPLQAFFLMFAAGGHSAAYVGDFLRLLPVSFIALTAFGLPFYLLLRHFRKTGVGIYAMCGWCAGMSAWLLARMLEAGRMGREFWSAFALSPEFGHLEIRQYFVVGLSGVLAALVFWVIARPDLERARP
jgi:hypothetical protein